MNISSKRIYAGIIDYIITCIIQAILVAFFFIKPVLNNEIDNSDVFNLFIRIILITFISTLFLVLRDIFGKKSIGKNNIQIKNNKY